MVCYSVATAWGPPCSAPARCLPQDCLVHNCTVRYLVNRYLVSDLCPSYMVLYYTITARGYTISV